MIEIESLYFKYPNTKEYILKNISLKIGLGELVAIMGSNGSGKTTLIKHFNGLLKPSEGSVKIFGKDTRNNTVASLSKRVGLVFQNPGHQIFSDTVWNELTFALKNFGLEEEVINKRVKWALEFFNLTQYKDTSPLLLSGGEKKRLCLASVLAWNPDYVVLDEPTVGQDFLQKEKLREVIRMLVTQNKSVVIVSHDVEFIWLLQPRLILLCNGEVIKDDRCIDVFSDREARQKCGIISPQLLELYEELCPQIFRPPIDALDARSIILKSIGRVV
ncbi:MAG: energy-coupling factor ABC transporter ATP-binding protein [Nitrososphaeria archaeon]